MPWRQHGCLLQGPDVAGRRRQALTCVGLEVVEDVLIQGFCSYGGVCDEGF